MNVIKAWNGLSLIVRICIGLAVGVAIALVGPLFGMTECMPISLLGSLFTSALKAVAPILVFFLVISALANAKAPGSMKSVVLLYVASTLIAGIVAVVACYVFPIGLTLANAEGIENTSPEGLDAVLVTLLNKCVSNPVDALMNANYLGILVWGVGLGIALRAVNQPVKDVFQAVSDAVSQVVKWIIACAPFGILGLIYDAVSTNGPEIFIEYGQIILLLVGVMFFVALVTNPILVFLATRENPYPLVLRCLKDSGITAFFTRSSAANIPVNMELCHNLGLNRDLYSVSIPLGATINMAGACITISVLTMACAHTLGIQVDPVLAVILCVLAAVSACGASGVPGGSLLLIPLACSLFGIGNDIAMQVVAVGFIIAVIQDSCETALNSSSDALFSATADYAEQKKMGLEVRMGKDNVPHTPEGLAADWDPMLSNELPSTQEAPMGTVLNH